MTNTLESLHTYDDIAGKLISKFGQPWMHDDEYKNVIITSLVKSDQEFKKNKGASLASYRFGGWKFAKMKIFQMKKRKRKFVSVSYEDDESNCLDNMVSREATPLESLSTEEDDKYKLEKVKLLINNQELTKTERLYLSLIYQEGMTHNEVACKFNVTKQAVSFTEQKALRKLRAIYATK